MEGIIVWPFTLPQNKKRKNEPISQQFTNPLTQLKPLLMIKLRSGGCWDPVFDGSTHMFTGSIVHVLMVKSSFFLYIDSQMYDDIVKSEQQWLGQLLFWVIWLSHIPMKSGEIHIVSRSTGVPALFAWLPLAWDLERRIPGTAKRRLWISRRSLISP